MGATDTEDTMATPAMPMVPTGISASALLMLNLRLMLTTMVPMVIDTVLATTVTDTEDTMATPMPMVTAVKLNYEKSGDRSNQEFWIRYHPTKIVKLDKLLS